MLVRRGCSRLRNDLEPSDMTLAARLGFAYKESGAYEKAVELLTFLCDNVPDRPGYWLWLGDAQRLLGAYDAALESMQTMAEVAPEAERDSMSAVS